MIFKCWSCGHIFEDGEEAHVIEDYGERRSVCPICHGDFGEATACKICGSYEHIGEDEEFCANCAKDVHDRFDALIDKNFTKEERELLNILCWGAEF